MLISDWSSDVCSSDLSRQQRQGPVASAAGVQRRPGAAPAREPLPHRHDAGKPPVRRLPIVGPVAALRRIGDRWLPWLGIHRATAAPGRSEEHTSELQSLMRISYAVFCLKKKKTKHNQK